MKVRLKPIAEQVIVITGASSGIGLTTAREAARRGAKVVMAARNREALDKAVRQLARYGQQGSFVVADVGLMADVRRIAQVARENYGGFDTWVNNAGVSIYGRCDDVPLEDQRRLFDTNFWGVVHGSLVAVDEFKRRGGGALINIGSELSDVAAPLQSLYSASKHAVKGFTDALRMELEAAEAPISVTLVKPAAIDTMFVPHAANYMDVEPRLPPPLYAPDVVADAILFAARHRKRDIYVGAASKFFSLGNRLVPRLVDKYQERYMFRQQRTSKATPGTTTAALYQPGAAERERHGHDGHVCESSLYTKMTTLGRG